MRGGKLTVRWSCVNADWAVRGPFGGSGMHCRAFHIIDGRDASG
jgi:hypothetical protein